MYLYDFVKHNLTNPYEKTQANFCKVTIVYAYRFLIQIT